MRMHITLKTIHIMSKIKKKLPLLMAFLLLLPASGGLHAQGPYRDARTGTVGLRLDGGASWSFGSSFENVGANQINLIQPYGGAGLFVNIRPWVRLGADYSFTQMVREQLYSTLQPVSSGGVVAGSTEGAAYRDFKTRFHGASLTGEFNLLEIGGGKGPGRLSLWLGTGLGYLFARGSSWTLSVSDVIRSDNWTQTVHFGGHNEPHRYNALFIPATLSLEYAFLPQVALTLGGGYRFLPGKTDLAPKSQAYAKVGLVFNLTGKGRHTGGHHPVAPAAAGFVAPVRDTVYVDKVVEKTVEKVVEVPAASEVAQVTDDMLPYVTFERGSAKLDEWTNASALATLVSVLKANPSAIIDIFGWTDHSGSMEINEPLSAARAGALRDYLVSQGIDASRIGRVEGRGNYPLTGEEAYSVMARRAEAVLRK